MTRNPKRPRYDLLRNPGKTIELGTVGVGGDTSPHYVWILVQVMNRTDREPDSSCGYRRSPSRGPTQIISR